MKDLFSKSKKERCQFKSYYCVGCKQQKPCHTISQEYCCSCAYQIEQERAREYSSYQLVYQRKKQEKKDSIQQLQLLKDYPGCRSCSSKEIDAYNLYENNQLVCQPCLIRKEGRSSSPISLTEQQKWYKKHWKIDLGEWLENYDCLPFNADCARKWLKDNQHLDKCDCLELEAKETYELFANSLRKMEANLKGCQCEISPKVRVSSDYYAWCEKCEESILVASKKRVIKNRNDPRFWGLEVKEKVLCGNCLGKLVEQMPANKKYTFNKYLRRGYWSEN